MPDAVNLKASHFVGCYKLRQIFLAPNIRRLCDRTNHTEPRSHRAYGVIVYGHIAKGDIGTYICNFNEARQGVAISG
jgi:hypothetical protein